MFLRNCIASNIDLPYFDFWKRRLCLVYSYIFGELRNKTRTQTFRRFIRSNRIIAFLPMCLVFSRRFEGCDEVVRAQHLRPFIDRCLWPSHNRFVVIQRPFWNRFHAMCMLRNFITKWLPYRRIKVDPHYKERQCHVTSYWPTSSINISSSV